MRLESVVVAHGPFGGRGEQLVTAVGAALEERSIAVGHITVPGAPLPDHLRAMSPDFVATPAVLAACWRSARFLEEGTAAGDVVVVSELAAGGGGMFALEQSGRPPQDRRRVIVAAGDGEALHHMMIAGTIDGVEDDIAYAIDWELAAYRYADLIVTTSESSRDLLAALGFDSIVLPVVEELASVPPSADGPVFVADPPSRLGHIGEVMRGLSAIDDEVFVADGDRPDHVFTGSAWDAVSGLRQTFGDRIQRGEPLSARVVVVGDPFRLPDDRLRWWREQSPFLVPAQSALAAAWPDAAVWTDADDLEEVLSGRPTPPRSTAPPEPVRLRERPWTPSRAQRVSVAVPVFRDVRFLDECVDSIASQTQRPHEIILIDDGSMSEEVSVRMEANSARHDGLVRLLSQRNRGVCAARNRAWEEMTGDAYLFVDADDLLAPEFIEVTAAALRADPELWAAATWTRFFGDYEGVEAKPPFTARTGRRENTIVSTSVLMGPEVKNAGLAFAPDLAFLYCEDWELWSRIIASGGAMGLVPRPLAFHRVHASSGGHHRTALAHSLGKARAIAPLASADEPMQRLD